MNIHSLRSSLLLLTAFLVFCTSAVKPPTREATDLLKGKTNHYLYVASPGIRNYLEHGGHGILVYDMDNNFRFVKRIKSGGLDKTGKPSNVKGVCVSIATRCIYISTLEALQCIDLVSEKLLWEKTYEGGCDRMAISPDGKTIYLPSLEKGFWNIIDAKSGNVIKKLTTNDGAHNTIYGPDGRHAYLGGLRTTTLGVADTKTHTIEKQVGPFAAGIRPFTINGDQTLCFVNVNELLGFEIGDLKTGKKLHRVEVEGFERGPVKRHSCPSHGIGLTPDEEEIWLCDSHNQRIHVFENNGSMPPKQKRNIRLKDQPGWITFSLDGKYAFPSTGEVVDVNSYEILTSLKDENGADIQSEKMVEIHFQDKKPVRAGDQFGIGRAARSKGKLAQR
jgi:DNA-binding beta-propeller fold protein YncE